MKYLSFSIPGSNGTSVNLPVPSGVPTGGLFGSGQSVIQTFINLAGLFAILLGLFLLILSGFQWMNAAGDKQKLQSAKSRLIFTIIGLVVVFASFLIINLVSQFFGTKLISP